MMKINRFSLYSELSIIVLIFSLLGTYSQATAKTAHERSLASGVPYNMGDVFAGVGNGKIKHFNSTGVLLDTLDTTTGSSEDSGMAFGVGGNLYATNWAANSMSQFDNQGNLLGAFGSGFNQRPESVVVNAAGDVFVGQSDGSHQVLKFSASGTLLGSFNPVVEQRGTDWIDLAADQCTLFYTSEGKLIKRFDVCIPMQLSDFATLPISGSPPGDAAFALRIRPNQEVMVTTSQQVFRLNSSGTVIQTYPKPAGETSNLFALNLDPDLTSFWTAGYLSGNVYKIDITTGTVLQSFNAGILGHSLSGLAVFGEPVEPPTADLSITKSDTPDPVVAGGTLTYTVTLTNNGPSDAMGVMVTDTLSIGVTLVSATPNVGTCTPGPVIICDINDLLSGASATITIDVTVDSAVACGSILTNTAIVSSNESDPDSSNNTASTDTAVSCQADLSIIKSDSPDPVTASSTLTYTLTVTNNGPNKATGVTITDTLPIEITLVSATPSLGTCVGVTCDIGDLEPGASATVTIDVIVDPATACGSMLTNTAEVSSNASDPDSTNNTASTETLVSCPPEPCTILDDFNRPNGPLGNNWDGRTNGYRIVNNEVAVRAGGPIYWQPEAYGSDQEACVKLTRINLKSRQHALLLKVQELNDWRQGAILVSYNARSGDVEVEARDVVNKKWVLVGSFTTPVVDGDQLRAQAFADGTVEVVINNISIGTADAGSFYADKGGQIGLWFLGKQEEDKDNGDKGDDRESLIQARERNSNGDDEHEGGDDDGSSAARHALLDDFGGGTIITTPTLTLTQICSDSFTNTTSQHKTQVEPDTFSNGSTIVSAQQTGRFTDGGASNICWSTTMNNGGSWVSGSLPGITKHENAANPFDRVSDPAVAYDAKHNVWMVSTLAVSEAGGAHGVAVLTSRSTDGGLTWDSPVTVVTGANLDKNWIVCDNTPASPFYGNCYTEWDDVSLSALLQMSTSGDGGLTWGPKKQVGFGASGLAGQPVVQPNGTVIVPYMNGLNATQILAFLSTDGGVSWGNPFLVSTISFHDPGDPGDDFRVHALPAAEIDAAGKVYVVWPDCRFRSPCTSNDLVMSTSTDGMSWTSVIRVPIGTTTDGADNFIPGIAVDNTTSGTTAKVAITYYYYPVANCTFATCQLHVGFISSPDGGANWTGVTTLAGPMTLSWLPRTTQGRMVGDYISTSYGSDGLAHGVFMVAKEPTGNPDCFFATPNCDQATYTTSSGLALSATANAPETLIAAEVGILQPPVPLNTDEYVPDQSNLTLY